MKWPAKPVSKIATSPKTPLTALQLELLKLYSTDMTTEELLDLKLELARHFAGKATAAADRIWGERQLTGQNIDAWLDE